MIGYEYCAFVINGVVVNIVQESNIDNCAYNGFGMWLPIYPDNYCGIGWTWDGEQFLPPEIEEVEDDN